MNRILWLASWYPNELALQEGDFIQRHARAVSRFLDVDVFYIVRDAEGKITRNVKHDIIREGRLTQHIIYYYSSKLPIGTADRLFSYLKYQRLFKSHIKQYISEYGQPSLVHVHVGMKAGMIAEWIRSTYDVPYVISEHWSGFLPESTERFEHLPSYLRQTWKNILDNAAGVSTVSAHLKQQMQKLHPRMAEPVVIPNVVDTNLFYLADNASGMIPHFVHVSDLGDHKNPTTIIEAFSILQQKNIAFMLDVFGRHNEKIQSLVEKGGLNESIHFHGEIPQPSLAEYVRNADALILFSSFETFGCVVIEAGASGVPVIVSDIPSMRELVKPEHNGIIVASQSAAALAESIEWFLQHRKVFNRATIAEEASNKYSYDAVGKMFVDWYQSIKV